jgi:hypothetical protein
VDNTGLLLSVIGTVAGVIGAYFGYVGVRPQLTRRRNRSSPPLTPPPPLTPSPSQSPSPPPPAPGAASAASAGGATGYDVFVSYGREDAGWVRTFAARLGEKGVRVAYDEVVSRPGGVRVHTVEAAIRAAAHGLLVFSPASTNSGWAGQEYAALMQSSIETGRLFIPVVIGDVELPGFAATRYCADFRGTGADPGADADGVSGYEQRVDEIATALRER